MPSDPSLPPNDIVAEFLRGAPASGDLADSPTRPRRRRYSAELRIAENHGQGIPPITEFLTVVGRDLSCSGMSFYCDERPPKFLVLELYSLEGRIYVTGEVRHCHEGFWLNKHQFLVGCNFTGRVTPPPSRR